MSQVSSRASSRPAGAGRAGTVLVVTGTGTGVGKTVATAAIATLAVARGARVAVLKPAQTGIRPGYANGDVPDVDVVTRLSGVTDTHELARYPEPLSPEAAARASGLAPVSMADVADYAAKLALDRDLVLVEGAGGLLVRYDGRGATIADLAASIGAPALIVAAAGLGTLNHVALTLEALRARHIPSAGVVIGSWPREPGLAEITNLADLEAIAREPLAGILPAGAGQLNDRDFAAMAQASLTPRLGGLRGA
ncbi:MAG: ATP-dependent dethiobiotin synthetase BioD [Nocardiopsaceae bacterium]|nr:ATP-dependent dethiobiotin synthetase BioD [Nocardiopsaceae bacterium]